MRQFYEQVRVDSGKMSFFAECPVCRARRYSGGLPLICRTIKEPERLERGRADWLRQRVFNKCRIAAVQGLARYFNYCCCHDAWICDGCFHDSENGGLCAGCTKGSREKSCFEGF